MRFSTVIAFMRTEVCEAPFQLVEHACIHADERKKRGQNNETTIYISTHYIKGKDKKTHPRKKNPCKNRQCGIIQTWLLQDTKSDVKSSRSKQDAKMQRLECRSSKNVWNTTVGWFQISLTSRGKIYPCGSKWLVPDRELRVFDLFSSLNSRFRGVTSRPALFGENSKIPCPDLSLYEHDFSSTLDNNKNIVGSKDEEKLFLTLKLNYCQKEFYLIETKNI